MPRRPLIYTFFDASVGSHLDLRGLPSTSAAPEINVRVGSDPPPSVREPTTARHDWRGADGTLSLSLVKSDSYRLVFPDAAQFAVSVDGTDIVGWPLEGNHADDVGHALLTQVLPRVLSHRGRLVLHASAVVGPRGAIAILGRGGAGKSTLAAACLQDGVDVVADDCLALRHGDDGFIAMRAPRGVRLDRDTAARFFARTTVAAAPEDVAGKVRITAAEDMTMQRSGPVRLAGAVLLQPSGAAQPGHHIQFDPLTPAGALMAFIEHSFQLELWDRRILTARFREFAALADAIPVVRVSFGRNLDDIATLRDRILDSLIMSNP